MKHSILLPTLFFLLLPFVSCMKKGVIDNYDTYGAITITGSALSNIDLYVYINDSLMGPLSANRTSVITSVAHTGEIRVTVYKTGNKASLLADTVVAITANKTTNLDVIYSDLMGYYGWWDKSTLSVPADSMRMRIKYVCTATIAPAPPAAYNMQLYTGSALKDSFPFLVPLTINSFSEPVTFLYKNTAVGTGAGRDLYARFNDPVTGNNLRDYSKDYFHLYNFSTASIYPSGSYILMTITISDDMVASHPPGNYRISYPVSVQKIN